MKLSKQVLKKIIKEEIMFVLKEANGNSPFDRPDRRPVASDLEPEGPLTGQSDSPSGLDQVDPTGSVTDTVRQIRDIIIANQVHFSGQEKVQFFTHLKDIIESYVEADISTESGFRLRLGQLGQEAEKINRRK